MKIRLWRGFHSPELLLLVKRVWNENELLVLCPPYLANFNFCRYLPEGVISLTGDWDGIVLPEFANELRTTVYANRPVLGVFTSGTVSGQPRLVLYAKRNIEASIEAIFALFDSRRVSTIFCYAQPFHTFGLLLGYVLSMKVGADLVTPDGKYTSASHLKRAAVKDPNCLTLGTPAHFFDLLSTLRRDGLEIEPSYSCIIGGASVSVDLWRQIRNDLKIEAPSIGYGCSEASPGITHLPPGVEPKEDSEIGFALGNLESQFEASHVAIRGPSLCMGIIDSNGVDFSLMREIRDSIKKREDGVLVFQGRSDLVMNRGGEKISLELLELTALKATGIELLAIPMNDTRLGQDLGLLIKADDLMSEAETLRRLQDFYLRHYRLRLNAELCHFVPEFPRNVSFKPSRIDALKILKSCRDLAPRKIFETSPDGFADTPPENSSVVLNS